MEQNNLVNGTINVTDIIPNPNNPRTIKKEQLERLKKSITDFPKMLSLRPIILNEDNVILGGNMRLKALKELGYETVPFVRVTDLTEEQQQEFIIKDNVNYGDWNWDVLTVDWSLNKINNWGLDVPRWINDDEEEPTFDADTEHRFLDTYINSKIKQIVLFLSTTQYEQTIYDLERIMENEGLESNTDVILYLIQKYNEGTSSNENTSK